MSIMNLHPIQRDGQGNVYFLIYANGGGGIYPYFHITFTLLPGKIIGFIISKLV
jgi:hypothetical protein